MYAVLSHDNELESADKTLNCRLAGRALDVATAEKDICILEARIEN